VTTPGRSNRAFGRREFIATSLLLAGKVVASEPALEFLSYDQAEPALKACKVPLPAARGGWSQWIEAQNREIRARLAVGELDSLVNFVLFGVSFTGQPRADSEQINSRLVRMRIAALIARLGTPGDHERLIWVRQMLANEGHDLRTPVERERAAQFIEQNVSRYLAERQRYRRLLDVAPANDPVAGELYKNRGLSLDTNFRPNYAIEESLAELMRRGALRSVRRAAIIGPGLDFTDKDSGFDFYPLQTLQPFALVDSLMRLGLSRIPDLRVTVFDISRQTLDHLSRAIRPARPYTIQLALDRTRPWNPEVLAYWKRFGDHVGSPVKPLSAPPQLRNVESGAIRVRPEVVAALDPQPLNIVLQHLNLSPDQRFDLIVATNVFVYYDRLQHVLSMVNLASMLVPGGIFLSNSPLEQCPGTSLHSIGNADVTYSQAPGDSDRVEIYSNATLRRGLGPE
jgi:hypothetical protein